MSVLWPDICNLAGMKTALTSLFLLLSLFSTGQSSKIAGHIKNLNNSQFIINHEQKASFKYKSSSANKLIRLGKSAVLQLIEALNDPSKNIMAQLVLCHIYFKKATFAGPKTSSNEKEIVYKYFLGEENGEGLIISETTYKGNYTLFVEPGDLAKIISYWKKKTEVKKK